MNFEACCAGQYLLDQGARRRRIALPKKRPRLPWAVAESPSLARTTAYAPRFRGPGGPDAEALGTASCDRPRRFLRLELGPGFPQMLCSPSVSVRLSRRTDRGNRLPTSE
jgi:hypothetical protein